MPIIVSGKVKSQNGRILRLELETPAPFVTGDQVMLINCDSRYNAFIYEHSCNLVTCCTNRMMEIANEQVEIQLVFSPISSIKGAKEFISANGGHWPLFHDDYITSAEYTNDYLCFTILDSDSHIAEMPKFCRLELIDVIEGELVQRHERSSTTFSVGSYDGVKSAPFCLKNESLTNIILTIDFYYSGDNILMELSCSQGLDGTALCRGASITRI